MKKGKLIVIEGVDGSGKGTLTTMLENELRKRGEQVRRISFPRYGEKSAIPLDCGTMGKKAPYRWIAARWGKKRPTVEGLFFWVSMGSDLMERKC